jgi:Holliday junction resolvase
VKLRERDIQRQVMDWLSLQKLFHYRQNVGAVKRGKRYIKFGHKGLPDVVAIVSGVYVGLEFKREGEDQTPEQTEIMKLIREAGGQYGVIRKLEDAQLLIEETLAVLREVHP